MERANQEGLEPVMCKVANAISTQTNNCWSRDEQLRPLTQRRGNNLLSVVSIFTNILLVPFVCIIVTTHNEINMYV
jgi:hypothetical protein